MTDLLIDTQQSLAAAIARLEIQRLRIEKLKLENVHLRNVLRAHDINPGEGQEAAADADAPAKEGQARSAAQETVEPAIQMTAAENEETSDDKESHDILLHTRVENGIAKIPGRVTFKDDRIEFVAIAADIRPETFQELRYLGDKPDALRSGSPLSRRSHAVRSSGGKEGTWWDSLFGSQDNLAAAGSMPKSAISSSFQTLPAGARTPRTHSESPALSPRTYPAVFTTVAPAPSSSRMRPTETSNAAAGSQESGSSMPTGIVSQMTNYLRRRSLPEAPVTWDRLEPTDVIRGETAIWQVSWNELDAQGNPTQTLSFEASKATRLRLQSQVAEFQAIRPGDVPVPPKRKVTSIGESRIRDPESLIPGTHTPQGVEDSKLLSLEEARCVAAGIPGRKRLSNWKRLYCSEADGFSLQTMYRAGAPAHHSVLLVEDFSGHLFGAYCTEALRVNPRYQGNGECFVFQVRPHRIKYDWHQLQGGVRNDFFMMVSNDSLGIGGAPHFAIWLDSDLLYGNSGLCHTFSSPCLAGEEDFKVKSVELWAIKI